MPASLERFRLRGVKDYDRRLVDLYDDDNPGGPDHDYYRALADRVEARSVLDLGCGTGILTFTFSQPGRSVVGVDPSAAMLEVARKRSNGSGVRWVHGDSRAIPGSGFDYAVMTGNVAQHITVSDWPRTLSDLRAAMVPGALLAFESRNPAARAWEQWEQGATLRQTVHGPLREWSHVKTVGSSVVALTAHNVFESTGEHVVVEETLVFRTAEQIRAALDEAHFHLRHVWGDWAGVPFDGTQSLMVFEAVASG
jgi:SAM-dependent methyltransferase